MSINNQIRAFTGTFILTSLMLANFHDYRGLYFTAFVGLNLFQSSFTGFCPLEIILRKIQNKPVKNEGS